MFLSRRKCVALSGEKSVCCGETSFLPWHLAAFCPSLIAAYTDVTCTSRPNQRRYFWSAVVVTHVCHVSKSLLSLHGVCYGWIRAKAVLKNIRRKPAVVPKSGMKCFIVEWRRKQARLGVDCFPAHLALKVLFSISCLCNPSFLFTCLLQVISRD